MVAPGPVEETAPARSRSTWQAFASLAADVNECEAPQPDQTTAMSADEIRFKTDQ
jgi:hypothetical protein